MFIPVACDDRCMYKATKIYPRISLVLFCLGNRAALSLAKRLHARPETHQVFVYWKLLMTCPSGETKPGFGIPLSRAVPWQFEIWTNWGGDRDVVVASADR